MKKVSVFNKLINGYQVIGVDFEEEIKYTANSGNSTIIPMNKNWNCIGIQTSGGLDSSLLLYLTAKTIKDLNYNIKILPIGFEVPSKLKSIDSINKIVDKVRELLDVSFILPTKEFYIPLEECSQEAIDSFNGKDRFMNNACRELLENKTVDFIFNGNTKNPPKDVLKTFHKNQFRQSIRDNPQSIYSSRTSASPHAFVDKADIIDLYIKENILNELSPLTLSCDQFVYRIIENKWSIPCKRCWWCDERAYGFHANGVEDTAPSLPNIWE